jgi:uncharacterized membrane protein SpoIIM required for sporulation
VDLDAYVAAHRGQWDRLGVLVRRARRASRLTGPEIDELVTLYQQTATHLSAVRSAGGDPALVARLSMLVARGRSAATGAPAAARSDLTRFALVTVPAAIWRVRWWWLATSAVFVAVSLAIGVWVGTHPDVQSAIASPDEVRQLVEQDFQSYYSSHPASAFAAHVWTNNAWLAAGALSLGVLLGLPTLWLLWLNAANVGVAGGLMAAHHRLGLFFGLILPHGLLELTAVLLASAAGLRIGWTVIDPGRRTRSQALGDEVRAATTIALALVAVLAVAGTIEAFVTPSGLPTWARIAIGCVAEAAFLAYVVVFGRRAVAAGETGDLTATERGDRQPVAG